MPAHHAKRRPPVLAWSANTPSLVDFGQVALGQAVRRELTLLNTSAGATMVATLRVTGPNASRFTLDAPCALAGRLDGMSACTVTIGFAPTTAGRAEGWIEISADASNAPLVRISAAGVATPAAQALAAAPNGSGGGGPVGRLGRDAAGRRDRAAKAARAVEQRQK